jgi:hypothetical protein
VYREPIVSDEKIVLREPDICPDTNTAYFDSRVKRGSTRVIVMRVTPNRDGMVGDPVRGQWRFSSREDPIIQTSINVVAKEVDQAS